MSTRRSNVISLETRTRMMLANDSTWPGPALAMKRHDGKTWSAFGLVYVTSNSLPVVIHPYGDGVGQHGSDQRGAPWHYENVEDLIADGWLVD